MVSKLRFALPLVAIVLLSALSGCAAQKSLNKLSPEEVVTRYWADIDGGDYAHAYELSYHSNLNVSSNIWIDERKARWGDNGSYIRIYSFKVTGAEDVDSSLFEGNFTEARIVSTNATIAYMGTKTTGQLRMVLVNTTGGWKVFGNY